MQPISKLLFTPRDHQQDVSFEKLVAGLQNLDWLGAPFIQGPENSFFIGEGFFRYITFMGCAPAMRVEPEMDGDLNFCFIHINLAMGQPQFRGHQERFVPRCPECRHGLPDWKVQLGRWEADPAASFSCPHCEAKLSIPMINWREKAGVGRSFIEVYSVYPHEGIPTPTFLSHLNSISGVEWKYFFEPG